MLGIPVHDELKLAPPKLGGSFTRAGATQAGGLRASREEGIPWTAVPAIPRDSTS
jgi:hypothetical protein